MFSKLLTEKTLPRKGLNSTCKTVRLPKTTVTNHVPPHWDREKNQFPLYTTEPLCTATGVEGLRMSVLLNPEGRRNNKTQLESHHAPHQKTPVWHKVAPGLRRLGAQSVTYIRTVQPLCPPGLLAHGKEAHEAGAAATAQIQSKRGRGKAL